MPVWHENKAPRECFHCSAVRSWSSQSSCSCPTAPKKCRCCGEAFCDAICEVNPCDPASSILLKLMPFRDRIPEDFNVSGAQRP